LQAEARAELQRLEDGSLLLLRAIGYRERDYLRLISLHADHDSAYEE
jgi:hypothetical protein